jgi:hypothetical protein
MTENENNVNQQAEERRNEIIVTLNNTGASNQNRRDSYSSENRPKAKVVAKGKMKQESFGSKLKRAFFGENVENVGEYMLFDVGIPAFKATVSDMFANGIEVLLFGESRGGRRRRRDRESSYASMYRDSDYDRRDRRDRRDRDDDIRDYRDLYFESKREASDFVEEVFDYVKDYGRISVSVYMSIAGITVAGWKYDKQGWYKEDLAGLKPIRTRDGWEIYIPISPVRIS